MPFDADTLTAFAYGLGSEATSAFVVGVIVLLWTFSALWGLTQHYWMPMLAGRLPTPFVRGLHGLIVLGVVLAAGAAFAALASQLEPGSLMGRLDEALLAGLRDGVSRDTLAAFAKVTRLGDTATLLTLGLAVAIALAALNHPWLILPWVGALAGNGLLNTVLKQIFERARPEHSHGLATASGWSFPSGHASGAVVTYGLLTYFLLRLMPVAWVRRWGLPVALLAVAAAFATGCSRAFLQVHHPSDVLAGFASGTAWLLLWIGAVEAALLWRMRQTPPATAPAADRREPEWAHV